MTPDIDFMLNKLKKVRDEADPTRHPAVYRNGLIEAIAEIERLRAAAVGANVGAGSRLPTGVYYSAEHDNFYSDVGLGMGDDFLRRWKGQSHLFPQHAIAASAAVRADETSDEKSADTPVT